MTIRIRLRRDSSSTGSFEWAVLDDTGLAITAGSSPSQRPPAGACELVIASDLVLLDTVPVPAAQQRRLASSLRFLVEDSAIQDPERLHVTTGPASGKDALSVAIIDRQWMEQMLARLEALGLFAKHAHPECLLAERAPGTWTIVCGNEGGFARTGDLDGFALDVDGLDEAPVALRLALEQVRGTATAPDRLVVRVAPGAAAPRVERWSADLGVPVEAGPEWRWLEARGRSGIDLLQGEFAPRVTDRNWTRTLRRPALLAGALLILSACGTAIDWSLKARERRALTAEMAETYRRVFGESAVVVDPPLQMTRGLEQLRRQSGESAAGDFIPLFAKIAERMLDPAKHRIESIGYSNGVLSLAVRPVNAAQFSALYGEMRASSAIPGVNVTVESAESTGKFSLRATVSSGGRK